MSEASIASEQTMRRLYELFNAREIEAVLEYMHSEVDWPNEIDRTRIVGLDRVWDYWMSQFGQIQPQAEPIEIETLPDGRLRVRVRIVVNDLEGRLVRECELFHVYEFRDGRIVRMDVVEP